MKVPNKVTPRTSLGDQDSYLQRAQPADTTAISRGLGQLGQGIERAVAPWQQDAEVEIRRQAAEADRIEKSAQSFTVSDDFSKRINGYNTETEEAKRTAPVNAGGYYKSRMASLDKVEQEFFDAHKDMAADENAQYKQKFTLTRGQYGLQALDFQQKGNDAYVSETLGTDFNTAKVAVDAAPEQMEAQKASLFEKVDKSNLSEVDKHLKKKAIEEGLALVSARRELTAAKVRDKQTGSIGNMDEGVVSVIKTAIAGSGISEEYAKRTAWVESRGNPSAVSKTGASGLFQVTTATWKEFGEGDRMDPVQNAKAFVRLTNANRNTLAKALGHEPSEAQLYLAHQQGAGGAVALLRRPEASAVDALTPAYDGDRQKATRAIVVNGGNVGMTAGQFANLWMSKFNGANPDFGQSVLNDPKYAGLTLEQRTELNADAERQANSTLAEQLTAQKAASDALYNTTQNMISAGKYGRVDLEMDRANGQFGDFDQYTKLDKLIEGQEATALTQKNAADFWTNGLPSPRTEDANKMMNSIYETGGAQKAIQSGDKQVLAQGIVPMVEAKQDIPTNLVGDLSGMSRSQNQEQSTYALESMNMLKQASPEAYDQRFTSDDRDRVDRYMAMKNTMSKDEVMARINPSGDPQRIKAREDLRKQAYDVLDNKVQGDKNGTQIIDEKINEIMKTIAPDTGVNQVIPGYQGSGGLPAEGAARQYMRGEARNLIAEEYSFYGNMDQAVAAAGDRLMRSWSVSYVGGTPYVMRDAPDHPNTGYPALRTTSGEANHDWINAQARKELDLKEGEDFVLISDATTQSEVDRYKAWQAIPEKDRANAPKQNPPSYLVFKIQRDRTMSDPRRGQRIYFEPTPEDRAKNGQAVEHAKAAAQYQQIVDKALASKNELSTMGNFELPEDMQKDVEEAEALMKATNPWSTPSRTRSAPAASTIRPGGRGYITVPEEGVEE